MQDPLFIEALVHTARKRSILDRSQAARLHVLLNAHGIHAPDAARAWIMESGLLPSRLAKPLLERLPKVGQPSYGAYVPLVHLADGGMGSVYLATAPDDRLVVIKTMRGNLSDNAEVVKRFERESRFMMQLKHPNIVSCLDHGQSASGELYLVLEFVPSGDLKELTSQHGCLYESIALGMVYQIADALSEAHRHKLVHRDIKPPNVFVSYEGRAKLADFGIARSTSDQRTMLTMQGALVGSPYYMSPEQVLAESDIDIRSDIYAIGAVLYYCLTGTEPYKGSLQEVLHAHRTAPVPNVRTVRPQVSDRTAAIITRCMQKKRDQRYLDPAALRDAVLEAIAALETPGAPGAAIAGADQMVATMAVDFSQDAMPETNATVTMPMVSSGDVTVATPDPSAGGDAPAPKPSTDHAFDPTIAMSPSEWAQVAPEAERVTGDLATALKTPWIILNGDRGCILLYARTAVTMGKLCEPPIDICLRKYPITQFRDDCLRISRQHLRLELTEGRMQMTDLGSGNGTQFNNRHMAVNAAQELAIGSDHVVGVAGALTLSICAHARQGDPIIIAGVPTVSVMDAPCGLERELPIDAVVVSRSGNRPEMAYALVMRRLTVGGANSGAMLCLPTAGIPFEVAVAGGNWLWRATVGTGAWSPLTANTKITSGTLQLTARPGGFDIFQ